MAERPRAKAGEIERMQFEIANEIAQDGPQIARMVFGTARDQPDMAPVTNDRLDQVYRDAYLKGDREWLHSEAQRDPEQFLKVTDRIGVQVPPPTAAPPAGFKALPAAPPMAAPPPAAPPPMMTPAPALAPPLPVAVPPVPATPRPVILGPNGQPLPLSGV